MFSMRTKLPWFVISSGSMVPLKTPRYLVFRWASRALPRWGLGCRNHFERAGMWDWEPLGRRAGVAGSKACDRKVLRVLSGRVRTGRMALEE